MCVCVPVRAKHVCYCLRNPSSTAADAVVAPFSLLLPILISDSNSPNRANSSLAVIGLCVCVCVCVCVCRCLCVCVCVGGGG
ncbi:MAG: hypothetical protein P4L40_16960 [Terracidiphilus sp.]|nr:hypothetical protein [Terracidiphilus sp.]